MSMSENKKAELMAAIIMAATIKGDKNIISSKGEAYKNAPFASQVLIKKMEWAGVKAKITEDAALLLTVYAEGSPGFIQLLALRCLEKAPEVITVKFIINLWPMQMPNQANAEWEDLWQCQKIPHEFPASDNLVDNKRLWELVEGGLIIEVAADMLKTELGLAV